MRSNRPLQRAQTWSQEAAMSRVPSSEGGVPKTDLETLYRRYASTVMRRASHFYGPEEAEEVTHEVFMRVIEKLPTFREQSSPVTWLYRLTTNYCLNRLRNERRRRELLADHHRDYPAAELMKPDQEQRAFVSELWRQLDPELQQLGVYYFIDGLTQPEIARVMGLSLRTVGYRLQTLRQRTRQIRDRQ